MFVQYVWSHTGSSYSGLLIIDGFRRAGHDVIPVCHESFLSAEEMQSEVVRHGQWLVGGTRAQKIRRWGRDLLSAAKFLGLIKTYRPDCVYVNNLTGFAPALAARLAGIPCIWHVRELFEDVGGEMRFPLGGRRIVNCIIRLCGDHQIYISRAVKENVLGKRSSKHSSIVSNAVHDNYWSFSMVQEEARKRLNLNSGRLIVGVPGTLRPVKGHKFMLEAIRELRPPIDKFCFAISGDGESRYRISLENMAREFGVEASVRFLGTIQDMRMFYRACDLVCVPSESEPFGRIVIEAFAMGTPVIGTRVGGIVEIIRDRENGLLVNYGDVHGLAELIVELGNDCDLRERLRSRALDDAVEFYRSDIYQQRIIEILASLVRGDA